MNRSLKEAYSRILKKELVTAMGCTEPIAIAYAAAKARSVLGRMPEEIEIKCSGNIIKNVKGVTVPNSGGLVGIEAAAILGVLCGLVVGIELLARHILVFVIVFAGLSRATGGGSRRLGRGGLGRGRLCGGKREQRV